MRWRAPTNATCCPSGDHTGSSPRARNRWTLPVASRTSIPAALLALLAQRERVLKRARLVLEQLEVVIQPRGAQLTAAQPWMGRDCSSPSARTTVALSGRTSGVGVRAAANDSVRVLERGRVTSAPRAEGTRGQVRSNRVLQGEQPPLHRGRRDRRSRLGPRCVRASEMVPGGPPGPSNGLSKLEIIGERVTWLHDGAPRSAALR